MGLCFRDQLASSSGDGYITVVSSHSKFRSEILLRLLHLFFKIWSLEEDEPVRQYTTDSPVYCIDWSPQTNEASNSAAKDCCQRLLAR